MSGRPEPLAAKRPRSSRPGSASSGSGGKLGGGGRDGQCGSQVSAETWLPCRRRHWSQNAQRRLGLDDAAGALFLFQHARRHPGRASVAPALRGGREQGGALEGRGRRNVDVDVVGADDAAAANASALPLQTARARALADVATRARLLERVHAYHSAVEDEVKMDRNEGGEREDEEAEKEYELQTRKKASRGPRATSSDE